MTKSELIKDGRFLFACQRFSLDVNTSVFYDPFIFVEGENHVGVLFSKEYEIIGIAPLSILHNEEYNKLWAQEQYEKFTTSLSLEGPLHFYSVKAITTISSFIHRRQVQEKDCYVSSYLERTYGENPRDFMSLLTYIKFLGEEIEAYYPYYYRMCVLGFEVPDVFTYLKELASRVHASSKERNRLSSINPANFISVDMVEQVDYLLHRLKHYVYNKEIQDMAVRLLFSSSALYQHINREPKEESNQFIRKISFYGNENLRGRK